MSKSKTTTLAYSVVGESELYTELGKSVMVSTNTHLLGGEHNFTQGIVSSMSMALSLDEAEELVKALQKAIKVAKKAELAKFEKVVERVNNIPSTIEN